jgi:Na+/H+ antiporter NhaD/arsenite permease-like protein
MAPRYPAHPRSDHEPATFASHKDLLRPVLVCAGLVLVILAGWVDRLGLVTAGERTALPFLTLAMVIAGGAVADRLGVFRLLARVVLSERVPSLVASASLLTCTAVISGAINLDVAAVVAPPLAIRVAARKGLNAARLVVAAALTANATSFLLPTSNITSLLVLDRTSIPALEYVREGWAAWLLVTVLTVGCLALVIGASANSPRAPSQRLATARPLVPTILDLVPMFVIASAMRALLGGGITLRGGVVTQFLVGSLLAAGANNLPVAAVVRTATTAVPWGAICAMAMGPNLLVTGSIASIICRRSAIDLGVRFESSTFSLLGASLLPFQFVAAYVGLTLVAVG